MTVPAIFVSHSHKDDEWCHAFVATLRAAGLDVWYDEHNATAGHLRELIERELRQRTVFVVVLSPAALASQWVSDECDWAYSLYRRDPAHRIMLPVLAETVNEDNIWLYMQQFKRIEQAGLIPWPVAEAARRVALAINPNAPIAAAASQQPVPATHSQQDEADALLARANALVSQGKRREAIDVLRHATIVAPRSVAIWNALGFNLTYLNQDSEALEAFERVLLLEPDNALAWAGKTNALSMTHPQQALISARKALALSSGSIIALNGQAVALIYLGRYQEALDACDRVLSLDPNHLGALSIRGDALCNLGRYLESLESYERALAIEMNAIRWSGKGNALCGLGRYIEALEAYNRSIMLNPNDNYTWQNKAHALRTLGRNRDAEEAERKAKELEGQA